MTESQSAKDAIQRVIEVFRKRPEAAKSTAAGRCRLEEGLACAYFQDGETANMDMPPRLHMASATYALSG